MSAIQIIQEQAIGFDATGKSVVTAEYFIKLKVGFRRFARQFKGARLYFFLEVAFQEADIHLRGAQPLTIPEVCELWDISRRSVVDAVEYLVSHNFIVKVGVRGPEEPNRGAYMYRPSAFAWFGAGLEPPQPPATDRYANFAHPQDGVSGMQILHTSSPETAMQNSSPGVQKAAAGVSEFAHVVCKTQRRGVQKTTSGVQKTGNHIVDDIGTKSIEGTNKKQRRRAKPKTSKSTASDSEEQTARAHFRSFGIGGVNLGRLSKLVSPAIAEEWALYARHTDKPRDMVQGICFNSLMSDPLAPPPCSPGDLDQWRLAELESEKRAAATAEYERQVAAGEMQPEPQPTRVLDPLASTTPPTDLPAHQLWQTAIGELQLQMTKATFETWVKPTFAVSFDPAAGKLVVGVKNAYAQQWLENRLNGMIERTLNHCHGAPVIVEFLLRSRETEEVAARSAAPQ